MKNKMKIYVGTGTCGLGAGAGKTLAVIETYLKEKNIDAEIVNVGCIGLCYEEPIVDVQLPERTRVSFGRVTKDNVVGILDRILNGEIAQENVLYQFEDENSEKWDKVPLFTEHEYIRKQTRWVLSNCGIINPVNIDEYIERGGYEALKKALGEYKSEEICDIVEKSNLRGRGGGGFPTGRKWKIAHSQVAEQKYFICNADEGDPGAFMDRAVIEGDPHRLIEGMVISAYAIGASKAYVYIRAEYPLAIQNLEIALKQAEERNLVGDNILGSGCNLHIKIKKGAGAFVCGEETALIHSIEGKRGMPSPRPPYPAIKGLFDCPTIINNVETIANVPKIVRDGWEAFAKIGTSNSKGTKVFALSGKLQRTGLVEVAMGTPLREIVFDIGGGIANNRKYKAVQIGGPSGGCIPEHHLDIEIDYESLKTVGAIMGSGGLVVMDEDTCMVDVAKFFMDFIQKESCGKCTPCREGTKQLLEILTRITEGRNLTLKLDASDSIKKLEQLARIIQETSLCGLGQTAPNPVLSTLRWFRDEYEAHIYEKRCPAGVCKDLIAYSIDKDKCKGCTMCAKKCPSGAIVGEVKQPHYIMEDKCVKCGICMDTCKFGAVKISSTAKTSSMS